jgi:hypothetical protein
MRKLGHSDKELRVVGLYQGNKLPSVSNVRAGFVSRLRRDIFADLPKLQTAKCPFINPPEPKSSSRWGESLTAEKMKRWQGGRLLWRGGLTRLGDDGPVAEENSLTSLKGLDSGPPALILSKANDAGQRGG